jgi:pimeloyl-ACP methyl ester carboxylesterase
MGAPLENFAQKASRSALANNTYAVVEGHKVHYQQSGKGTVTVVFESGHRDNMRAWNDIYPEVAKFAKVIRYDREGYGLSDTSTPPASLKQIANRLHELLVVTGNHPPYVLVGHSLGGILVRAFTFMYPNEVAGLVMVDPATEYIGDYMGPGKERELSSYDTVMSKAGPTDRAEWDIMKRELLNGSPELNSFGLPDIPMALFVAAKNRPPGWEQSGETLYRNRMRTLSEVRFIEMPQSPHYVQFYYPSLVIESIRRVVFPDADNILEKVLNAKGVDSCIAEYKRLKGTYPKEYMQERFLNTMGYEELNKGHMKEAIKLFALNVQMYPESANVYDSLGEAYADAGNKQEAIKNYKKSVSLDPNNSNAVRMLKKLSE